MHVFVCRAKVCKVHNKGCKSVQCCLMRKRGENAQNHMDARYNLQKGLKEKDVVRQNMHASSIIVKHTRNC